MRRQAAARQAAATAEMQAARTAAGGPGFGSSSMPASRDGWATGADAGDLHAAAAAVGAPMLTPEVREQLARSLKVTWSRRVRAGRLVPILASRTVHCKVTHAQYLHAWVVAHTSASLSAP